MATPLNIGNISVMPGEMKRGGIPLGGDMYSRERQIPIIVYRGIEDGPILWLNGATHGDEPEGPFSIFKALSHLDPKTLKGTVVAVPVMNVESFTAGQRGDPLDTFSYDMNRLYPGKPEGYPTERVAWAHWQAMKENCDLQINIHSGGEHSYLAHMIFSADTPVSLELAAAMGPNWTLVFRSGTGGGNPSSQIAGLGKGGVTVELGGNCRTLTTDFHNIADDLAEGYLNVMRHYGMIEGKAEYAPAWRMGYQIALLAPATGMFVGTKDIPFETNLPKDTVLGKIYDLYGDVVAEVRAPRDGVIFGLRSRPSVLEGQWVCFFGVVEETVDNLIPGRGG
ncbi:MAG: succinylglutamate desuccinylase/aspartoacylase family protein [Pleurocapsa minor GSE-CHR-MK-17-07R]|jgi:predicted deacylase|nr:succinylglutamate desuccinylase/aspartoacylase family protein [Pleurocapsa minor GSE-CHR-MK 17-07R]